MVQLETFDYNEIVKNRGTKKCGFFEIGLKPDGSMMKIPYVIVVGEQDGPTLLMDGGIHGDEVEGADAIANVYRELDPKTFKGVYLGIPHLNLEGFNIGKRVASSIDYTAADMNRVFPGDDVSGKISTTIIAKYVKHFVEYADYWVTFHSGGNTLYLEPIACYTNTKLDTVFGSLTYDMARCFMTPYLWRCNPGASKEGSTATMRGLSEVKKIAYICLEMGGNVMFMKDRERIYKMCHDGIRNLLNYLKMTDGPVPEFRTDVIDVDVDYLHITHGGIYHPTKYIFDRAKKGEVLGYVTDIFGNVVDERTAPYDGIVVGTWTPPVIQPREWCCLFGKFQDEE